MGKHARRKTSKTEKPKTRLGLPDLDHSKAAVLESLRSPESKCGYRHAIDQFIQWYCSEPRLSFNKVVVSRLRIAFGYNLKASVTDSFPLIASSQESRFLSARNAESFRRTPQRK